MASILLNASVRQTSIIQLRKRYTKMKPMDHIILQGRGDDNFVDDDEDYQVLRMKSTLQSKQQSHAAHRHTQAKKGTPWRIHIRRLSVKVNGFRKRLRGSIHGSRALVFHGATSTAANLIKSTSFFCHFNQRFQLMFLSTAHLNPPHTKLT
eukprot:Gb_03360 [translate_table: standard]